jgi:hypothetical protein
LWLDSYFTREMKTYILLVAGNDYSGGGTNINLFAERRAEYLLDKNPLWQNDSGVVFVHFDVRGGQIRKNEVRRGTRSWSVTQSDFDAIVRSTHYEGNSFKQQATNVLGVSDVYDFLEVIGSNEPGTVKELNFIGHGWMGGPIMVNSWERSRYKTSPHYLERDPWDKDGRSKDFNITNMPHHRWMNIRRAFKDDGYCWLWGCLFPRLYFKVLHTLFRTREYRSKRLGQHDENEVFQLRFSRNFADHYYAHDSGFFPLNDSSGRPALRFSKTLNDIKLFLERGMLDTYAAKFAANLAVDCYAGFLGTYSIHESRSSSNRFPLMRIANGGQGHGADFTKYIAFYKTYMNIPEDPEGRGYGKYKKSYYQVWYRHYQQFIQSGL